MVSSAVQFLIKIEEGWIDVVNHINKNIDIKALEERLSEEIEGRLEFGCYVANSCTCDTVCNGNVYTCYNRHC
jgi:hypothetical protein